MQRIYLIRNGKTVAEEQGLCCGQSDLPLSPGGESALRALRAAGGYPDAAGKRRITSGALRARQTAALLFGPEEGEETLAAFRELDYGAFELQNLEQLKTREEFLLWQSDPANNRTPGGESGGDVAARVRPALAELLRDGRDAIVVTHGGVIAAIMSDLFPESPMERQQLRGEPGKGWCVTLEGEKPLGCEPVPDPFLHQERTLPKKWAWAALGLVGGALISVLLAAYCVMRGWAGGEKAFLLLTAALLVGSQVVRFRKLRCPYCGRWAAPLKPVGAPRLMCPRCGRVSRYKG